jgi:hypothetical protein
MLKKISQTSPRLESLESLEFQDHFARNHVRWLRLALVGGALVSHGSLVRVIPASDARDIIIAVVVQRLIVRRRANSLRTSSQFWLADSPISWTSRSGYSRCAWISSMIWGCG